MDPNFRGNDDLTELPFTEALETSAFKYYSVRFHVDRQICRDQNCFHDEQHNRRDHFANRLQQGVLCCARNQCVRLADEYDRE